MNNGPGLLTRLDASLSGTPADRDEGMIAAAALNALLMRHHLVWDDVMTPGSRLAKLCGRLGSDYEAEREAAYDHAVRLLRQRQATWSDLVGLPNALLEPAPPPTAPTLAEPVTEAPPEADWITTVRRLNARAAWRSDTEHILLESLAHSLADGQPIEPAEARWLRDIWWHAELTNPDLEDTE